MTRFTEALTLYMQDYAGPVGFRMALTHPERVHALIVQNAVAHNEGLGANWKPDERFGQTELPTRVRFAPTSYRFPPRVPATIPTMAGPAGASSRRRLIRSAK
jgi:pimeloyl-ACP methyl ester carboxylesterase